MEDGLTGSHQDVSNKDSESSIQVPEHILDMIPGCAQVYLEGNRARLLAGIPPDQHQNILEQSTHNQIETPERRELHRKILQSVPMNFMGEKSDRPIMVYISGPMAVGKTTLCQQFDKRIVQESERRTIRPYGEDALENVYQLYKQADGYRMQPDVTVCKQMLPEFESSGKNFTLIRVEAAALGHAVTAWAKELGANIILEQMGDADMRPWAKKQAEDYSLVVIGVTANPVVNAQRLQERCKETGQKVTGEELAKTIIGYSQLGAFFGMSQHATHAVLLASDYDYRLVYRCDNGKGQTVISRLAGDFVSYADREVSDLVATFPLEEEAIASPRVK